MYGRYGIITVILNDIIKPNRGTMIICERTNKRARIQYDKTSGNGRLCFNLPELSELIGIDVDVDIVVREHDNTNNTKKEN